MLNCIFYFLLFLIFSFKSVAITTLNTQCTKNIVNGHIDGFNINKTYSIASVTKVFTTHWAISAWGSRYRFPTIIHITPIANNIYDVHIEGSLFPYFDKTMFQFLAGELNKLSVGHVKNLTFDENFTYSTNIRTNALLAHGNADQDITEIINELRTDTTAINTNLAALNAKALAVENLQLPNTLFLLINSINFVKKNDFKVSLGTISYNLFSSELYRNLKEMNRNSNNFVADKVFKKLSETENYIDFVLSHLLTVKPAEIILYNGSGYPILNNGNRVYNEASCSAVIAMMDDLRQIMINTGLDLKDVLPVAGKDSAGDGDSTVTQIYGSEQTSGTLVAKTGSVIDTISLAGLVATANENIFFQTSYKVGPTSEDRALAYSKIKDWLSNQLIKDKKKSDLDSYRPKTFLSFDGGSQLKRINSIKLLN